MWQNLLTSTDDRYVALRSASLLLILVMIGIGVSSQAIDQIWPRPPLKPLSHVPEPLPWAGVPNGGLTVKADELDFGLRGENNWLLWKLTIHNPTDEPVTIEDFESLCSCFIFCKALTIRPGESEELRLFLDLTPRDPKVGERDRQHLWPLKPIIREHSGQHPGWELHGRSRRAFCLPSHSFSWTELPQAANKKDTRRFRVRLFPGTTGFAATSEDAEVEVAAGEIEALEYRDVQVKSRNDNQIHESDALIKLTAKTIEGFSCSVSVRIHDMDSNVRENKVAIDRQMNGTLQ